MYNLNIFDKYNINITWSDVYYGVDKNLLDLNCVSEYAVRCLETETNDSQEIIDLAWESGDRLYLLETMADIIHRESQLEAHQFQSVIKWQYCIIKNLKDVQKNFIELSNSLDEIYADFDYPEDMEEFVSYMPIKDGYKPKEHSKEENIQRKINKIDEFLDKKIREIHSFEDK